jgi:hypothetical protein
MSDGHIEDLYNNAREALYAAHINAQGGDGNYLIRAMVPYDIGESSGSATGPGNAANVWAETVTASATAAFQNSNVANQNVPDNTTVCLYGLVDSSEPNQSVSQIRITTGQGVRAIWDLFPIIGSDPAVSGSVRCRTMYAMTPIIITRNMNILIEYFIRPSNPTRTLGVEIAILGLTCELSGGYIQP